LKKKDGMKIGYMVYYLARRQYEIGYRIGVDYTSIEVPLTIEEIRAEYEAIINKLNETIDLYIGLLNSARDALNQSLSDYENLSLELLAEKDKNQPLINKLVNKTMLIEELGLRYTEMETNLTKTQDLLNEYKSGLCILPTGNGFYFNWSSAILTLLVLFIVINIIYTKKLPGSLLIKNVFFKEEKKDKQEKLTDEDLEALKEDKK